MTTPKPDTIEFLLQLDVIQEFLPKIGKELWQTLYCISDNPPHRSSMWCALLDREAVARALENDSWDLSIGDGSPGFSRSLAESKESITYHRFGGAGGVRPLVLYRSFHGAFPQYAEIDEEFRLYHNLAEDKPRGLLLSFDSSGREIEVVRIRSKEVRAQLKYLRQFQAGVGLYLALFIDSVRYSKIPIGDIPSDEIKRVEVNDLVRWRRNVVESRSEDKFLTFSRFLGKVILPPPAQEKACIWPFRSDDKQNDVAFIIGVDGEGNEIEWTSNPDDLKNNFGANPGSAHYLTPVYFRREVLAKYFAEPERYKVSDGQLTCLSLWSCQIDNDLKSRVMVFLGDLGRDLPFEERLHWRGFNVVPEGKISETNFQRSFLAQFTDAQAADLTFRRIYANIIQDWERVHGWPLFLPFSSGDSHLLDTIRIPVTNSQSELDEQIGDLTKLLVDSLNEKEIMAHAGVIEKSAKGISKLEGFLEKSYFPECKSVIQFLRDLQTLRSTGSAHRKGSGYEKIIAKLGVDPSRKPDAFRRILEEACVVLSALRQFYCKVQRDTE